MKLARTRRSLGLALGVATVGLLAWTVGLEATPPPADKGAFAPSPVRAGPGIPANMEYPIAPLVMAVPPDQVVWVQDEGIRLPLAIDASAASAGTVAGVPECLLRVDCDDCDPCTVDACVAGVCQHTAEQEGGIGDCTDGIFCNGIETCQSGTCAPGTPPCTAGQVCSEDGGPGQAGECTDGCTGPENCPDDGLACNGDEICAAGGFCAHTGNPCGTGASCVEPAVPGGSPTCGNGRCCEPDVGNPGEYICSRDTKAACEGAGNIWLGVGGDDGLCDVRPDIDNADDFQCPRYSSAVAPQGAFGVTVGPADAVACEGLLDIGDDYTLQNVAPGEYFELTSFRYVGGSVKGTGSRLRISFYDAGGNFIVDTITNFSSVQGVAVRTVGFSESPILPATGFVTLKPAKEFSETARVLWVSTDATDVGSNDAGGMWANGGPVTDFIAGSPDVLAFEMIGNKTAAPLGACCDSTLGNCTRELPWDCEAAGNVFQGVGTYCRFCTNDFLQACDLDSDCNACVGGTNDAGWCNPANGDADCPGGTCTDPSPTCLTAPPACGRGACCDPVAGGCHEVDVPLTCDAGEVFQGFGTNCSPNCCEQPTLSGGDTCADAPVTAIIVPPVGDPPVTVTVTGDNRLATPGDFPDTCSIGIFNTAATNGDPGWWEAFSLSACGIVRVDLCCTSPVLQPQWSFLVDECPCGPTLGNTVVGPPVGSELAANDRGAPFCNEDNLWMTYGPLPAGTYYQPVYSAPNGTRTQYQMHITVQACPVAACCTGDSCAVTDALTCAQTGGYWLGGANVPGEPIVDCGSAPCATGSCCLGPGNCLDDAGGGSPMDKLTCDNTGGDYVGGALCDYPLPACPACELENAAKCQLLNDGVDSAVVPSDLSTPGGAVVHADDFIPDGGTINSVCVWGSYLDGKKGDPNDPNASFDCVNDVSDNFLVTVYADAGGMPGAMVGQSTVSTVIRGIRPNSGYNQTFAPGAGELYAYQLALDTQITGLTPGECHWLEVVNDTSAPEGETPNTCVWMWAVVETTGNQYGFVGTHDGSTGIYDADGAMVDDLAFCVDTGMTPGGCAPIARACCQCPAAGGTCDVRTFDDCQRQKRSWDLDSPSCPGAGCSGTVPGDDCLTDAIVATGDVSMTFDTSCTTTDGPRNVPSELGNMQMGSDIWIAYNVACTGVVTASMCGVGAHYDSAIAIVRDAANPTECICPGTNAAGSTGSDEGCTGYADGGAGYLSQIAFPGECLLVRVGGFDDDTGVGTVNISCVAASCFPASPATAGLVRHTAGHYVGARNNRFLSIDAGDAGRTQAIRVTFVSLPPPFDVWNGAQLFVSDPTQLSELGGVGLGSPPPVGGGQLTVAPLRCDPSLRDWSAVGTVHAYHEGIVPGGVYNVQVVDSSCALTVEGSYSAALVINTAQWSDVVGGYNAVDGYWGAGDNSVDVATDVVSMLDKFGSAPTAPSKFRMDLEPSLIDGKINITDVTVILDAFGGASYPFSPTLPAVPCAGP